VMSPVSIFITPRHRHLRILSNLEGRHDVPLCILHKKRNNQASPQLPDHHREF